MTILLPRTLSKPSRTFRFAAILALGIAALIALLMLDPIPQDATYHDFADQQVLLGIPHFKDVITNLAFVALGIWGLALMAKGRHAAFQLPAERLAYYLFFLGLFLTGFGSGWYHLAPTTERLFWDRLPMALSFMPFLSIVISERVEAKWGIALLPILLILGSASVIYWHLGEERGSGDLRFYLLTQFFPMLAIPLFLLLFPPRYSHSHYFWLVLGGYGLAKIAELLDEWILSMNGLVSGHNIKHVLAALGAFFLIPMLKARRLLLLLTAALLTSTGCSSKADRPNIVILLLDCVRADHLSCYGYKRRTSPRIDILALRGTRFELAMSQAPWTFPSVTSLFTGCHPLLHGAGLPAEKDELVNFNGSSPVSTPDPALPLMAELFKNSGYGTYVYSSNALINERFFKRGCLRFECKNKATAAEVVDFGIETIRNSHQENEPFLLYLHFMDSHQPIEPPEPFFNLFTHRYNKNNVIHRLWKFGKADNRKDPRFALYREQKTCVYDGSIRYSDEQIGRLIDVMKKEGIFDETIFVVLADHGEELWDHADLEDALYEDPRGVSGIGHGHSLFQELLHVPLILTGPGVPKGDTVSGPVRIIDVLPTLLELADIPWPPSMEGRSLLDDEEEEGAVFSESVAFGAPKISLLRYPLKYIFSYGEDHLLYDIQRDPRETENLLSSRSREGEAFREKIEDRFIRFFSGTDRPLDHFTIEELEHLKNLGYVK